MKKIMVVDDEEVFVSEFSEMLRLSGYQPYSFLSGHEALRHVSEIRPDLILLDLNMEGLDGLTTAKKIGQLPEVAMVPIIVVTGNYLNDGSRRMMKDKGIVKTLRKPVRPVEIIFEIENTLQ